MLNFNNVAAAVILFPSICFTMKQLHKSAVIHNNSGGGLLKEVLNQLVTSDVLSLCVRGIKHSSRSTSVYIKQIPFQNDIDAEQNFLLILSEYTFDNKSITMDMYRKSCELIILDAVGVVQDDVYELLRRPEYGDRDLSVLSLLPKTVASKTSGSIGSNFDSDIGKYLNKCIEKKIIYFFSDLIDIDLDIDPNQYFDSQQESGKICYIFQFYSAFIFIIFMGSNDAIFSSRIDP
jgi:hypothetical protein